MRLLGLVLLLAGCSSPSSVVSGATAGSGAAGEASAGDSAGGQSATDGGTADRGGSSAGESPGAGASDAGEAGEAPVAAAGSHSAGGRGGGSGAGGSGGSVSGGGHGGSAPTCTQKTWYADADHDGFGNAKQSMKACEAPSGYVASKTDCYDGNAKARPGQAEWFPADRGDGSFDYDCSGAEELRFPSFSPCPDLDNNCPPPNHWPSGFTCDYQGMMAPYSQAEDGWRLYRYAVCTPEPCTVHTVKLPACGGTGHYGKPPLSWDTGGSKYLCDASPGLSEDEIARLPVRTQTCR